MSDVGSLFSSTQLDAEHTEHVSEKLHIQLHKMWDKVEVKRNNRGIDELKAGDVTNNIFGTENHCLTLPALVERLHNGESLLLRSQLWAHLQNSAVSVFGRDECVEVFFFFLEGQRDRGGGRRRHAGSLSSHQITGLKGRVMLPCSRR